MKRVKLEKNQSIYPLTVKINFKVEVTTKKFDEIKGLKYTAYSREIVVKPENEDKLFTKRIYDINKIAKVFKFDINSLYDLIKNYMPISNYINDVSLAFMSLNELTVYTPFMM